MKNLVRFGAYEEFELWSRALSSHFRFPPPAPDEDDALDEEESDHVLNLRTAFTVLTELSRLLEQIAEQEFEEASQGGAELGLEDPACAEDGLKARLRVLRRDRDKRTQLLSFWDFLDRYRIVAAALLRVSRLRTGEFQAFGVSFVEQAEHYFQSDSRRYLRLKYADSRFEYVLERDALLKIEMEGIREQLEKVFLAFFDILGIFQYMQEKMRRSFDFPKLLLLFYHSYRANQAFLDLLEESARYLEHYQPEMAEFIFGTRLAVKMETRRIFATEIKELRSSNHLEARYGVMQDAVGLLENAFRESLANMLLLLNPDFEEFGLFEDLERKYREMSALLEDLEMLYRLAVVAEENPSDERWRLVSESVQRFRAGGMKLLFFKDWPTVEQFGDEMRGNTDPSSRRLIMNRFHVYLSTLIGEVRKRSVKEKFESRNPSKPSARASQN